MNRVSLFVPVLIGCLIVTTASGCLMEERGFGGTPIEGLPSPTGTYRFFEFSPIVPPFGDIDAEFLDGSVPDAVSYDVMGGLLWRHVVLQQGELTLGDEGDLTLRLQFDAYETAPGSDVGPYQTCSRLIGGAYARQGPILVLAGIDSRENDRTANTISRDTLEIADLWSSCEFTADGTSQISEYHIRNLVLVRQK